VEYFLLRNIRYPAGFYYVFRPGHAAEYQGPGNGFLQINLFYSFAGSHGSRFDFVDVDISATDLDSGDQIVYHLFYSGIFFQLPEEQVILSNMQDLPYAQ